MSLWLSRDICFITVLYVLEILREFGIDLNEEIKEKLNKNSAQLEAILSILTQCESNQINLEVVVGGKLYSVFFFVT